MTEILAAEIPANAEKLNTAPAADEVIVAPIVEKPADIPITAKETAPLSDPLFPETPASLADIETLIVGEPVPVAGTPAPAVPPQPPEPLATAQTPPAPEQERGPGRPKGAKNKPKAPDFSDIQTQAVAIVNHEELSAQIFDLTTGIFSAYFGPEWAPKNEDERKSVVMPLAKYLKSKDVKDIPPGMMVCFVVAVYSASRINQPGTRSRLQEWWGKMKLGWAWFKFKFLGKRGSKFTPVVVASEPGKAQSN